MELQLLSPNHCTNNSWRCLGYDDHQSVILVSRKKTETKISSLRTVVKRTSIVSSEPPSNPWHISTFFHSCLFVSSLSDQSNPVEFPKFLYSYALLAGEDEQRHMSMKTMLKVAITTSMLTDKSKIKLQN